MPETRLPDPPGGGSGRFLDSFLPRMVANALAMAGVALGTLWLVSDRDADTRARMDAMEEEIDLLRHERDRMGRLNHELAREVHDAGMESEIALWQLRWTEERLRRTEADLALSSARAEARSLQPRRLDLPTAEPPEEEAILLAVPVERSAPAEISLGSKREGAPVQPLDPEAARFLEARVQAIAEGEGLNPEQTLAETVPGKVAAQPESRLRGLRPTSFDPEIPALRPAGSQLARDRAALQWTRVVDEAIEAECGGRMSELGVSRCEDYVKREAHRVKNLAVHCMMTGNATPFYVPGLSLDNLPTDSLPLKKGAILLCDGALTNLSQ